MAFAPSIGDVLTTIQLINDLYQKTVNAPGELQAAVKDVRAMKAELESMRSKIGDENSFVKKNGEAMLATITDTFEPLKEDLRNMKRLVKEFNHIPPFSPQKVIFGYFKIPDVKKIQENFNNYRAIYSRAFEHVGAVADAHTAAELKSINSKLENKNKELAKDITALKTQQREAAKIQEANNVKMDRVLKLLEQIKTSKTPELPSQVTSKVNLEKQLLDNGLKNEDVVFIMSQMIPIPQISNMGVADIKVGPISTGRDDGKGSELSGKAPSRSHSISKIWDKNAHQSLPSLHSELLPVLSQKNGGSKLTGLEKFGNKGLKPTSPLNKWANQTTYVPKESKKGIGGIKILCVDRTSGFHSSLAQTYLELLRLWTANSSPSNSDSINWLFARVSTRDLSIATDLTSHSSLSPPLALAPNLSPKYNTAPKTLPMRAITALTAPADYFSSSDHPFEKATLVSLIEAQLRHPYGINKHDFELSDYILCFDSSVEKDLQRLKAVAGGKSVSAINTDPKATPSPSRSLSPSVNAKGTIIQLESTSWFIPGKHTSALELDEFISNMRTAIKAFAYKHLGWERPHSLFENGAFRTLQLSLSLEQREAISAAVGRDVNDMKKGLVGGVKEIDGILFGLAFQGYSRGRQQRVWITVPKEKAKAVEDWVKGLLSKKS